MANNALIQGAQAVNRKFLDVGKEVGTGLMIGGSIGATSALVPNTTKANEMVQAKVNNYMSKMKTDMDFTSFNPAETKSMRGFLLKERAKYAEAAKLAATYKDTTSPEYMAQVDIMQGVNNSFTNLASQLESYKKNKLSYAETMKEGLFSKGNQPGRSTDAMIVYGFYDEDGDGISDDGYDSPFEIQDGGNISFNVRGKNIDYGRFEEPFVKDTKFLNSLNKSSEDAYNSGVSGRTDNKYAQDAYEQNLDSALQSEDTLRSIIYDFKAEANLDDVGIKLDNGQYTLEQARDEVRTRLSNARNQAYNDGKKEYDRKQAKANAPKLTARQIAINNKIDNKLELLDSGTRITALNASDGKAAELLQTGDKSDPKYLLYDSSSNELLDRSIDPPEPKQFTRKEVIEYLNLYKAGELK